MIEGKQMTRVCLPLLTLAFTALPHRTALLSRNAPQLQSMKSTLFQLFILPGSVRILTCLCRLLALTNHLHNQAHNMHIHGPRWSTLLRAQFQDKNTSGFRLFAVLPVLKFGRRKKTEKLQLPLMGANNRRQLHEWD